ncbi:MAG: SAM-dependent methyltransferase [Tannerella sp.]|jgi:predicted O-methyltransferase YrrM|nr:SAM-dependent methyltransferase [Tannerella sp.]
MKASISRKLFCRGGYGVHSPFAFHLITRVIEERCPYYFYHELATARQQLLHSDRSIIRHGRRVSVRNLLRKQGVTQKESELLFRLANYCKPRFILTLGSSAGLVPLSLTGYASGLHCLTLESEPGLAALAQTLLSEKARSRVEIRTGACDKLFPEALEAFPQIDCLFLCREPDAASLADFFRQSLPHMHDETVCIMEGIRTSSAKYRLWRQCCLHPEVTATIDLYAWGLLFFRPGLHRRTYKTFIG